MSEKIIWHKVCRADDIDEDDVVGFTAAGRRYAVYRITGGYFATDGLCTHEGSPLEDGFVSGDVVECARHNARFHIPSGKVLRKPALRDLTTYPVKQEGTSLYIGLPE